MVDIVIVRSNSIIYNPRVGKISRSLDKKYSVSVLGWNREALSEMAVNNYGINLKLFNLKAPIGKGYLILYFPLYWLWVLVQLLIIQRPKAVHACDLDSAIPAYLYKIISGKKMVFDVCDRYAMTYIPRKFKMLYSLVNSLEEFIGRKSDILINVSSELLATFRRKPNHCAIIMNCSEDHHSKEALKTHKMDDTDSTQETLRLLYAGNIIPTRGLEKIRVAIKDLDGVHLDLAGRIVDKDLFEQLLRLSNIRYCGLLRPSDVWALEANSHVMISLYDLNDPISPYSMGNKLFDALMNGIPIITNVSCDLIRETGCGIIVDYNDVERLRTALVALRDRGLRETMGGNGRKAFLQKYNWPMMENELHRVYANLFTRDK